jgi:hypothetical protein
MELVNLHFTTEPMTSDEVVVIRLVIGDWILIKRVFPDFPPMVEFQTIYDGMHCFMYPAEDWKMDFSNC